jgi:hypothetical protein
LKLATYEHEGHIRTGAVIGEGLLLDLCATAGAAERHLLHSMQAIIDSEPQALDLIATLVARNRGDHVVAAAEVRFLASLPASP